MRAALFLLLLLPVAAGQDAHDAMGFPITFNDEVITKNDVLRSLGVRESELGDPASTIRNERTNLLMEKLLQRVAELYGLEVEDAVVESHLNQQIDRTGGEAKFYEFLAQRGQTLERWREGLRIRILNEYVQYMLAVGYTPDPRKRRFLPWNLRPTPSEIAIAFEHDPQRREAGKRVRFLELALDVDEKTRKKLAAGVMLGRTTKEEVEQQIAELLRPEVEAIRKALEEGRPFEELAAERGAAVEAQKSRWVRLPAQPRDDVESFLLGAEAGETSPPLPLEGGKLRLVHVLQFEQPQEVGLDRPEAIRDYRTRIHGLRRRKADALLRLRALDSSSVRPDGVREELRQVLLANLADAESGLRELGLH